MVEALETASRGFLDRILIALAKTLAIVGCTLTTVVLIIWVFTSVVVAADNFVFAMLSVYLLGGAAAVAIAFIINIGHSSETSRHWHAENTALLGSCARGVGDHYIGRNFCYFRLQDWKVRRSIV